MSRIESGRGQEPARRAVFAAKGAVLCVNRVVLAGGLLALALWIPSQVGQAAESAKVASVPVGIPPAPARSSAESRKWIRVLRDADGNPLSLQTAIVQYVATGRSTLAAPGMTVDLIGAVHVGDRRYYRRLNREFRQYDALLYELVAPKGTVVERGRGTSSANPVGALQNGMKSLLGLEHQLEWIDYQRKNFVHADISPQEFLDRMDERGESFLELYFRMVGSEIARQSQQQAKGKMTELQLLAAFFSNDRERRIKIALAEQFEDIDQLMRAFNGPDGSTIITERNKAAMEVLKEQMSLGRRKLAIFYGAGHLEDMNQRLISEFGMRPTKVIWLDAWNLED